MNTNTELPSSPDFPYFVREVMLNMGVRIFQLKYGICDD